MGHHWHLVGRARDAKAPARGPQSLNTVPRCKGSLHPNASNILAIWTNSKLIHISRLSHLPLLFTQDTEIFSQLLLLTIWDIISFERPSFLNQPALLAFQTGFPLLCLHVSTHRYAKLFIILVCQPLRGRTLYPQHQQCLQHSRCPTIICDMNKCLR